MRRWPTSNWLVTVPSGGDTGATQMGKKVYQLFANSNYIFFFGGRLRSVRGTNNLHISVAVGMVIPMVLYLVFESRWLWHHVSPAVVIMFIYCWLVLVVNFIRASTQDPGVLPKNIHITEEASFLPKEYLNVISLPSANMGGDVEVKYCNTCRIWRLPRSSHCSVCNCCIAYHDHHCKWLNNCVGHRNFSYFLQFAQFACICTIYLIVTSFVHLYAYKPDLPRSHVIREIPITLLLLIYSFIALLYPLLLVMVHYFLITNLITTREYFHLLNGTSPDWNIFKTIWGNRFNTKNVFKNWFLQCFRARGVSNLRMTDVTNSKDIRLRSIERDGRY